MRFYLLFIFISVTEATMGCRAEIWTTEYGTHRVAISAFWRTSHHDGKVNPGWWGWEVHAHPPPLSACYHHVQSCSVRSCWEGRCTPSVLSSVFVLCDLNPEPVQWVSILLSELRCTLMSYSLHSVLSNSVPIEPLCNLMSYSLRRTELLYTQKSYSVP
jgi:hypothetical protein